MIKERFLFYFLKFPNFILCRIRNIIYNLAFSTKGLKIGKNVSFSNTKNILICNNVYIGNNCWIDSINNGVIHIGNNVSLSQNTHIGSIYKVIIGDGCLIGSDVLITDHNHSFSNATLHIIPKARPLDIKGQTVLGNNVWLGDNVKVLSGVTLGENVIVAANSVVTKSFPCNVVLAGVPAKIIKYIN
ncbi:acyltransferase [Morganella morganii]|uniref:Acyltransferase n=1 Tax=Morganella morganii TaxID=582 RepID=A0AAI9HW49_MORMO|nr:acyltransferase [Morganella morganii]